MLWLSLFLTFILVAIWSVHQIAEQFVYPKIKVEMAILDPIVEVGETVRLHCRVVNPTRLPIPRVRISFSLPEQLKSMGKSDRRVEFTTYVLGHQHTDAEVTVQSVTRGIGKISMIQIYFFDNLGLHETHQDGLTNLQVIVRPAWNDAIKTPRRFTELIGDIQTKRYFNQDPSLFVGVRPYQQGDSYRHISWHATAKTQELMVKQFGYTTTTNCLIVFNGQLSNGDIRVFDTLCQRVVQLSAHLLAADFSVGLLTNVYDGVNRTFYEAPSNRPWQREKIWNRMGSVEPIAFSSLESLLYTTAKYASTGMTIVLLTAFMDQKSAAVLEYLARRYQNIIVYYVDSNGGLGRVPIFPRNIVPMVEKLAEVEMTDKGEKTG